MFNRIITIVFLTYYIIGSMFLPMGNFRAVEDLVHNTYSHETADDSCFQPLNSVCDYLTNIHGVFGKHLHRNAQKPHKSNLSVQFYSWPSQPKPHQEDVRSRGDYAERLKPLAYYSSSYHYKRTSYIFHPPALV